MTLPEALATLQAMRERNRAVAPPDVYVRQIRALRRRLRDARAALAAQEAESLACVAVRQRLDTAMSIARAAVRDRDRYRAVVEAGVAGLARTWRAT